MGLGVPAVGLAECAEVCEVILYCSAAVGVRMPCLLTEVRILVVGRNGVIPEVEVSRANYC